MADELRIREGLLNIISNAVKFTKDGGTISFVAENTLGNDEHHVIVRYRISDTGIGMSEELQTRIFDEFSQETDGARTSYKGTGLGMAIAKRYVDLMGGKIEVSSRQGVGSTFTVEIPLLIAEHVLVEKEEKLRNDIAVRKFKNHFIEFSNKPQLIEIKGETFADRLRYISQFNEIANTNIEAVFNLILDTADRKSVV